MLVTALPSFARITNVHDLVGYTIISVETIEEFEGCEYDKQIVFLSGNSVICESFGFKYTFYTDAAVLARPFFYKKRLVISCKMIVEDDVYDVLCGRSLKNRAASQYLLQCGRCDQDKEEK